MSAPEPAAHRPLAVFLVGPTAVGKTGQSLALAEQLDAEIISADSRLLYRGMDIGTAKPTPEERAHVLHHLIDVADPDERWSLGRYKAEGQGLIAEIAARGKLPLLVGGTGQYVRALSQGWTVPEIPADDRLRAALEAWADEIGTEGLHARLAQLDPAAAANIDHRNLRRTVRALEVIFKSGTRFSEQREQAPLPYRTLLLGLTRPRDDLYERVDLRIQAMLDAGLLDEVRALLGKYPADLPAFSAIGYREIIAHLQGELTLDEAVTAIKRNTRIYVRRQANWFKPDDPAIHWIPAGDGALDQALGMIRPALD